jgi:hypothetical protein
MAAEHDQEHHDPEYRATISLDRGEWVAQLTGPYLPDEGRTARHATLAGLHQALDLLYPVAEMRQANRAKGQHGGWSTLIEYDLGPDTDEHRAALLDARTARWKASDDYHAHGHDAATALARDGASLAEIAQVLTVDRWEAARLIAYRPPHTQLVHGWESQSVTHLIHEHAVPYLANAAPAAARQARIFAADALREARKRRRIRHAAAN